MSTAAARLSRIGSHAVGSHAVGSGAVGSGSPGSPAIGWLVVASIALGIAGCGGAPPVATEPQPPARPPVGALHTLVPEDATFVLRARPRELFGTPATAHVLSALLPEARLEAFAGRTGVDPRELDELILSMHEHGHLVIVRGPFDGEFAVREAGERMAPLESSAEEPFPRRAGFLGARRVEIAAVAPDVLVWVDGPPQLTAAVLAASSRAARHRPHAFVPPAPAELFRLLEDAPLAVHAPRPLGLPADSGIGLLLARESALAASVRAASEEGALAVQAELRGEFPPDAQRNFEAFAAAMAESDLGSAVGMRDALPTLALHVDGGRVSARAAVPASVLAIGLRSVLVAEMEELIEGRVDPHPSERAAPAPIPNVSD